MDRLDIKMIIYELRDTTLGVEGILLYMYDNMKKNAGEVEKTVITTSPEDDAWINWPRSLEIGKQKR